MLARVANNLFWMGRYIERSEHIARYLNVNYFSSLDAPNQKSQNRQFVLRSMMFMVGNPVNDEDQILNEADILYKIGLDPNYSFSILNNVKYARENANSARDLISTELYEAINKFYHFVINYPAEVYVKNGLHDFTNNITEMTAVLRGKIRGTLLHDATYATILMGVNIERATQITRMINAKYNDALMAQGSYGDKFSKSFEWTTLLKCAESYDMMRRYYKKAPTSISTLEFLILNPNCPRSVMNALNQVNEHVKVLNPEKRYNKDSTAFLIGRVRSEYEFKYIEEIENDIKSFIENILNSLDKISNKVDAEFFNY
ncbi:alpha-E domain-containing protein [Maribacter confluentis]|uniref:Alpha-E domain-containing protein n=1 Tax=Maribacter confluentis TaxID=1656093 RepID=A0ABT8RYZ1_9FLAO|nr:MULTISPECIES: alpha-E domain-containing protein [Maribacter]MDO1514399.1 alpha-E domain-containing protein [Maribacter confluentis]MDO1514831.1 alpha-E domain-containing protein [Maribacter confluentis]TVZ13908.1 putative alpha-E superfamily protein [Maribacter sp. MAR_2009_72]